MGNSVTRRVLGVTGAVLGGLLLVEALIVTLANASDVGIFNLAEADQDRLTSLLSILAVCVFTLLFTILLYTGIDDAVRRRPLSSLYFPALALMGSILLLLIPSGIRSVDLLVNSLRLERGLTNEPELELWSRLMFAVLTASAGWFAVVVLLGRAWPKAQILLLGGALLAIAEAVIVVALLA